MSIFFEHNGHTIWNPSNGIARLFLSQVNSVAEFLQVESGLSDIISDEIQIDVENLKALILAIETYRSGPHWRPIAIDATENMASVLTQFVQAAEQGSTFSERFNRDL